MGVRYIFIQKHNNNLLIFSAIIYILFFVEVSNTHLNNGSDTHHTNRSHNTFRTLSAETRPSRASSVKHRPTLVGTAAVRDQLSTHDEHSSSSRNDLSAVVEIGLQRISLQRQSQPTSFREQSNPRGSAGIIQDGNNFSNKDAADSITSNKNDGQFQTYNARNSLFQAGKTKQSVLHPVPLTNLRKVNARRKNKKTNRKIHKLKHKSTTTNHDNKRNHNTSRKEKRKQSSVDDNAMKFQIASTPLSRAGKISPIKNCLSCLETGEKQISSNITRGEVRPSVSSIHKGEILSIIQWTPPHQRSMDLTETTAQGDVLGNIQASAHDRENTHIASVHATTKYGNSFTNARRKVKVNTKSWLKELANIYEIDGVNIEGELKSTINDVIYNNNHVRVVRQNSNFDRNNTLTDRNHKERNKHQRHKRQHNNNAGVQNKTHLKLRTNQSVPVVQFDDTFGNSTTYENRYISYDTDNNNFLTQLQRSTIVSASSLIETFHKTIDEKKNIVDLKSSVSSALGTFHKIIGKNTRRFDLEKNELMFEQGTKATSSSTASTLARPLKPTGVDPTDALIVRASISMLMSSSRPNAARQSMQLLLYKHGTRFVRSIDRQNYSNQNNEIVSKISVIKKHRTRITRSLERNKVENMNYSTQNKNTSDVSHGKKHGIDELTISINGDRIEKLKNKEEEHQLKSADILDPIHFSNNLHQYFTARSSNSQTYDIDSSPFSYRKTYRPSSKDIRLPPLFSHSSLEHHLSHYPSRFGPPTSTPLPSFDSSTPSNISAQHGSNTFLLCMIHNLSNQSVSWIRSRDSHIISVDQMTFIADERFHVFHEPSSGSWSLQIKFVQARDDGTYECQVSSEPKISHFVHFKVVTPMVRIPGGSDIHVQLGDTVTLTCVISAALHHPTYVFWYQKGVRVVADSEADDTVIRSASSNRRRVTVERVSDDTMVATLLMPRASAADAGTYTCAPDSLPTASITLHVINGEHPAAMQHGASNTTCHASHMLLLSLLALLWVVTSHLLDGYNRPHCLNTEQKSGRFLKTEGSGTHLNRVYSINVRENRYQKPTNKYNEYYQIQCYEENLKPGTPRQFDTKLQIKLTEGTYAKYSQKCTLKKYEFGDLNAQAIDDCSVMDGQDSLVNDNMIYCTNYVNDAMIYTKLPIVKNALSLTSLQQFKYIFTFSWNSIRLIGEPNENALSIHRNEELFLGDFTQIVVSTDEVL
uniref:Limbic system-associated membrane protein n=1 Tax=Hirondellea gigas TaxID=1518452 RepID=A0A6A7G031_9CRUS